MSGVSWLTWLWLSGTVPEKVKIPPPTAPASLERALLAVLPVTLLLLSVMVPALLLIPPPTKAAVLFATALFVTVAVSRNVEKTAVGSLPLIEREGGGVVYPGAVVTRAAVADGAVLQGPACRSC